MKILKSKVEPQIESLESFCKLQLWINNDPNKLQYMINSDYQTEQTESILESVLQNQDIGINK